MEVILLEHVARLGGVGEVVKVRNGFARNYLIPGKKAVRATKENKSFIDSQRDALEKQNQNRKAEAEKIAATMQDVTVTVVRQASEDGKLYGSVAVRDITDALEVEGHTVDRRLIDLRTAIKSLGVFSATVNLHPEVHVDIRVHVARNADSPLPDEMLEQEKPKWEGKAADASEEVSEEASEADADVEASEEE